ncbi:MULTISPECIES: efflux RND transporter permease subunit [Sphingomonadales]|jgi:cobalt-zinc-cadmium resistance protein CzcA|uniref:Cytochrome-c peroxidase n=1 Tax=Novosphingobium resinovorum TaxID=158500 RepID=A0A1D8AG01_9SPHN|nr:MULTISPECIES: CusA/CzcA family heavy metal efflux RND transporter [Sphingomonadaceae]MAM83361.1 CusA/CzcA family heavy metal efflux RND transporter [Acidobacteriota bacterium]AOR81038.1 cytochrome-c peroxidase [Novosphingobium resinovorum]KFD27702.1 cytochrome C peroxidase [Sphingobium yanoikuyae]KZC78803.1 cytochrome-c peroxidase [Sphingobium yanoikuyae]MDG2513861.1 CusA/CzcA family heavy metal efflux RND transporter [Sphingobium yanoikuyae]|tara:strand:- start:3464 stop:6553 length:3090 start_codon:yes stop_codon:yes gene_type:complete
MLQSLVAKALSYRLLVVALALAVAGLGAWAFVQLPVDAYPNIAQTQVKIILKAPGMTPEEVESRVIAPIEMEMLGIPRQSILRSSAKYAIADITIDFTDGTDIYWARQQVAERLSGVMADLPASVSGGLAPISTPLSDIFMFTIEGPLSLQQKRELLDWTIRPALRTVPGVADVNALGGYVRTFEVRPDPLALAGAHLSVADIKTAIDSGNRNDGAGRLVTGEESLIVRAVGAIRSVADLQSLVITSRDGRIVRLGDVASVGTGSLTRYGAVSKNGKAEAVEGLVIALRGADARQVVTGVKDRLAEVERGLPAGTHIAVFYDRSDLIGRAIGTVEEALLEATVLVVILLIVFLGDWRAAAIVAVTLPMAALVTFLFMSMAGLSANLMSLGGLAIAIGMLVDGAVVVVENVVERLSHQQDDSHPRLHQVFRATSDVTVPVSAGIIIIALVFLPLLALQGLEGKLFAPVALTIVFALAGSLLLALTLVPVLASFGLKSGHHGDPWVMRWLTPRYRALLNGAFARKSLVYGLSALGLVLAGLAYGAVGKTFMPTMDEGSVIVQLTKLPSISLAQSVEGDKAVERALMGVPEVQEVIARVGADEIGLDPMGPNETDTFVRLKPQSEWRGSKEFVLEQIRKAVDGLPGIQPSFTQPIEMRVSEMLTGARGDLAVKIFGPDSAVLADLAGRVQHELGQVRGATEVLTVANDSVDYLQLDIDRAAAGRFGMPIDQLQDTLRAQVEGVRSGIVAEGQKRIPIVIRGDESIRNDATRFEDLQIMTPGGTLARVSDMAQVKHTQGPVKLDHENGSRFALVQAFVSGRDLVGYVDEAKAAVASKVPLPPGYRIVWGGQFENQQRASARLMMVIPVALLLIFFVLLATLRSLRAATLILVNIPFAMVGGLISLWASGEYLSVPASVGFIALLGIAVLNGLVLVSYFRQLRQEGQSMTQTVRLGAERRLRPVLMTASITAFGLVPLLFATGPGSEIQRPLAIVVIGGLVTSTLLTLVLLPILFERFGEGRGEQDFEEVLANG